MSKFQEGDAVRVNAKGKEYHGAMGIVKIPHIQCTLDPATYAVGVVLDMDAYCGVARWFAEDALLLKHRKSTKSLRLGHLTSKEQSLSVENVPRMKFEDMPSKPILPSVPPAAPMFKEGYFNADILQIGKPFNADLAYLERRMFAALGLKKELLGREQDHLKKQEATTLGFEKRDSEVQKRSAAEKLARFAESYGMSQETFKEYMNMPIPVDEARVAAKKNRLGEMKRILDRGLCIPKEHMAEYKALVDEVGEEYRLDMEKKQADNRTQRTVELTKDLARTHKSDIFYTSKALWESILADPELTKVPLKETWSATIVLASGREVRIPDPNPEKWELVETKKDLPIKPFSISPYAGVITSGSGGQSFAVLHEEGRCWIKDMSRIVLQTEQNGPFEHRFSYLIELRHFKEKAVEENSYPNALPTLSVLW